MQIDFYAITGGVIPHYVVILGDKQGFTIKKRQKEPILNSNTGAFSP